MSFSTALSKIKPTTATRRYDLGVCINGEKTAGLHAVHAGFSNKQFTNAQFKAANAKRARAVAGVITAEQTLAELVEDAKQLAAYVVKDWDNVFEEDGMAPKATQDKVREFLVELASARPDIFMAFRAWVSNADNFIEQSSGDPAELGK